MPKDGVKNPPGSGYMLYSAEVRDEVKEENPDAARQVSEISKIIGARWNALSDEEKESYSSRVKVMKEEHEAIHGKIERKVRKKKGDAEGGEPKGKKAKKDGPKRPTSAFLYFCNDRRPALKAANPDMPVTELSKLLGLEWKDLDDEDKEPFAALAAKDKERYEGEKDDAE